MERAESDLVDLVATSLTDEGWRVFPEVCCRWYLGGSDKPKTRRVDLYARAPQGWPHRNTFPIVVVEAKADAGLADIRIARDQCISAMEAFDYHTTAGGVRLQLWRPAVSLLVTWASWEGGRSLLRPPGDGTLAVVPELRDGNIAGATALHCAGIERDLWDHGCAVLYGPEPRFRANQAGFNQTVISMSHGAGR